MAVLGAVVEQGSDWLDKGHGVAFQGEQRMQRRPVGSLASGERCACGLHVDAGGARVERALGQRGTVGVRRAGSGDPSVLSSGRGRPREGWRRRLDCAGPKAFFAVSGWSHVYVWRAKASGFVVRVASRRAGASPGHQEANQAIGTVRASLGQSGSGREMRARAGHRWAVDGAIQGACTQQAKADETREKQRDE